MPIIPVVNPKHHPLVLPDGLTFEQVGTYMDGAAVVLSTPTAQPSPFRIADAMIPSVVLTDGVWIWCLEATVGVRDYRMALPNSFLARVAQFGGRCPDVTLEARNAAAASWREGRLRRLSTGVDSAKRFGSPGC